ncbi:GDSL-type esterase/lipase family protein [Kitasatospora sp. NPDC048545]|uniref:SGNH/GDSL hydrolase family protein n=1 Tax=Kitasatospora sp. NPDC048545 TaxID=3157208 RepID=UPI00340ACD33
MTAPIGYSAATATSGAFGATDTGFVENSSQVGGWDVSASRFNLLEVMQQDARLAIDTRDNLNLLRNQLLPAPATQVKVMACGDSITVGFGSTDGLGWRGWLADLIARQRVQPVMSMCAHGGWYLADLKASIGAALAANSPDLVLINIGTNDSNFTSAFTTTTYGALIDQILASSPTVKVACALVALSQQNTGILASEQQANTVITQAVNARTSTGRVVLSDHTHTTTARWEVDATQPGSAPPPGRWTIDGVHPTDAGYLQMGRAWYTTIQPLVPGLAPL